MAAASAPFVHATPKVTARKRVYPMDIQYRAEEPTEITFRTMKTKLSTAVSGVAGGADLTPLDFLLGVMIDPHTTTRQRIKAARVAARYEHPYLRFTRRRALGRKVSDEFTVPLCRGHHREVHRYGDEAVWWLDAKIDPTSAARAVAANPPTTAGLQSIAARGRRVFDKTGKRGTARQDAGKVGGDMAWRMLHCPLRHDGRQILPGW
jgi:hypothetical protein